MRKNQDLHHIPTILNIGHMAMVLEMILIQFQHQWQHHWHIHINGLDHHHLKDYPDLMVDHKILLDHQIHQCQDLQQAKRARGRRRGKERCPTSLLPALPFTSRESEPEAARRAETRVAVGKGGRSFFSRAVLSSTTNDSSWSFSARSFGGRKD